MATVQVHTKDPAVQQSLAFLQDILAGYHPRDFAVRFWDGSVWEPEAGQEPRFTLVLTHPGSVRRMFWPPRRLTVTEAYIFEDYDIEGDMEAFWGVCHHMSDRGKAIKGLEKLRWGLRLYR